MVTVTRTFQFQTQPQASQATPATYTMGLRPPAGSGPGHTAEQTGLTAPVATFNSVPLGATLELYVNTIAGGSTVAEHIVPVTITALPTDPLIYVPTGSPAVS
jgi:hypothetical protein